MIENKFKNYIKLLKTSADSMEFVKNIASIEKRLKVLFDSSELNLIFKNVDNLQKILKKKRNK
jgi:hypothetical protein